MIATDQTGIRHYDVQVRENGGSWTDCLTAVDYTGATFVGVLDTTYTFRIKATDNVSNTPTDWQVSQPTTVHGVTKYYTHGSSRACPECILSLTKGLSKGCHAPRRCGILSQRRSPGQYLLNNR